MFSCIIIPMGDSGGVKPKETRLSVRIPPSLKARLSAAALVTGIDEPAVVRQCLEAFCAHVEMHGRISLPLHIGDTAPASPPAGQRLGLNEGALAPRK
jgi:hypothetical protein